MPTRGTITARVFTSNAQLPLANAAVAFFRRQNGKKPQLLAFRLTNYDGYTQPLAVDAPAQNGAQLPSSAQPPYATLGMLAGIDGYDRVRVENAQIFSGIEMLQPFMLVPTPQLPSSYSRTQTYLVPAQPL